MRSVPGFEDARGGVHADHLGFHDAVAVVHTGADATDPGLEPQRALEHAWWGDQIGGLGGDAADCGALTEDPSAACWRCGAAPKPGGGARRAD